MRQELDQERPGEECATPSIKTWQLANSIEELQGTLGMDGWSSKKRKHLAAAVLVVEGKPYPTIVHDNSSVKKDGPLAFNQLSDEIDRLEKM